ncbi:protein involved in polysaccharide export with SLBB domain [Aquitalea magnusonii]|uniref:Protein involved in polysaccharide export with SLBB domain n=2 Tax=Aquitalea magnusonii TaxID=332411 RepID=A0A318J2W2_9NEIS|nr:protein involved in polysaccharide export with SLBB domain [Aquitalea magnusonii]
MIRKEFRNQGARVVISMAMLFPGLVLAANSDAAAAAASASNPFLMPSYQAGADTGLPSITNVVSPAAGGGAVQAPAAQLQPLASFVTSHQESAFAQYVDGVTGSKLDVFGSNLFQSVPTTFAPLNATQVNGDYVIGAGDELQIRGWGMVDIDLTVPVDRSGSIYLPRVGSVKVAGVRFRDLQGYLKKSVNRVFTNFDLTVSIAQTRAVQVYMVGHVVRAGTYTLSAMSTLLNALFASGGPSGTGTMRNIQVKRGGEVVTTFDLYDMLVKGDKSHDIPLQDGDVIYIPEVGSQIAITGNVKQPGIYELKGSTTLADVASWSGGFDSAAENQQIIIEKNVDNKYQPLVDLHGSSEQLAKQLPQYPVAPGNILRVFAPSAVAVQAQKQREFVTVAGEVKQTGVVQIQKGETLRELVSRLGGVSDNGYVFATRVTRGSIAAVQQQKLDELADRFEKDATTNAQQRMAGLTDAGSIANIQAELARQQALAKKMRSIRAEGRIVLELGNGKAAVKNLPDLPLQDGDQIYIPRRPDTVDVLGSVNQQSAYIYRSNRTAADYLKLAGGITRTGDEGAMYLLRADGTVDAQGGWLGGVAGSNVNPGDALVVPEKIDRSTWMENIKEWTTILYQFGLGAAALKVLKN